MIYVHFAFSYYCYGRNIESLRFVIGEENCLTKDRKAKEKFAFMILNFDSHKAKYFSESLGLPLSITNSPVCQLHNRKK